MTESSRKRSVNLLLSSMEPSDAAWENAVEGPLDDVDWPWVLERARAHKLIGLLAQRTLDAGLEKRLDGKWREELEQERELSREHRTRVARTLRELRGHLDRLECPFLVVKGSVYAHDLYDDPGMRRFSDIDILIPHEKLDAVDSALKRAGYYFWANPKIHNNLPGWFKRRAPEGEEPGSEAAAKRILAEFHRHHLYVLKAEDPRMHIEVHWNVFVPSEGKASADDLWSQTRPTLLEGIETRTLNREASLLHAAAHAMEQPPTEYRLLHLADVAWMLGRWGEDLDVQKLRTLAADWGLSGYLTAALAAVDRVLPSGIPEDARQVWPRKSFLRGLLLTWAGFGPWVADPKVSEGRWGGLMEDLWREGLWEIALGRRPGTAWGRISRAVQARVPGGGGADRTQARMSGGAST